MSHKLEKLNELLRQEMGKIILEDEEFGSGVLMTIMSARTSPDLREATLTISVLPIEESENVLKKLTTHAPHLQYRLIKQLKMHPVPKIRFTLTQAEEESQKIEKLIQRAKKDNQL